MIRIPAAREQPARVLVVDDHPAIHEALSRVIGGEKDLAYCGYASTPDEAFTLLQATEPDVAIIDLLLGEFRGLDLIKRIREEDLAVRILVFSMCSENIYAEEALRAGASGYLMKSASTKSVVEAIRTVLQGEIHLERHLYVQMLNRVLKNDHGSPYSLDDLTGREKEVFLMIAEGYNMKNISERLSLSRKTIETYRRNIKHKLGCSSVTELLFRATIRVPDRHSATAEWA